MANSKRRIVVLAGLILATWFQSCEKETSGSTELSTTHLDDRENQNTFRQVDSGRVGGSVSYHYTIYPDSTITVYGSARIMNVYQAMSAMEASGIGYRIEAIPDSAGIVFNMTEIGHLRGFDVRWGRSSGDNKMTLGENDPAHTRPGRSDTLRRK